MTNATAKKCNEITVEINQITDQITPDCANWQALSVKKQALIRLRNEIAAADGIETTKPAIKFELPSGKKVEIKLVKTDIEATIEGYGTLTIRKKLANYSAMISNCKQTLLIPEEHRDSIRKMATEQSRLIGLNFKEDWYTDHNQAVKRMMTGCGE